MHSGEGVCNSTPFNFVLTHTNGRKKDGVFVLVVAVKTYVDML